MNEGEKIFISLLILSSIRTLTPFFIRNLYTTTAIVAKTRTPTTTPTIIPTGDDYELFVVIGVTGTTGTTGGTTGGTGGTTGVTGLKYYKYLLRECRKIPQGKISKPTITKIFQINQNRSGIQHSNLHLNPISRIRNQSIQSHTNRHLRKVYARKSIRSNELGYHHCL
jgi:hypothetical protein